LKKLAGNPGRRKLNLDEPQFSGGMPICPDWMPDEGKAKWNEVVPELVVTGVLAKVDASAVVGYCQSYAQMVEAQLIINKDGWLLYDEKSNPYKNPAVNILNEAKKELRAYGSLLGLDPSSRSKLAVKPHEKDEDDAARFFGESGEARSVQ
jgi:P27 family predicted phage terminase small subunit